MGLNAIAENKENFLKDPDSQLIADTSENCHLGTSTQGVA